MTTKFSIPRSTQKLSSHLLQIFAAFIQFCSVFLFVVKNMAISWASSLRVLFHQMVLSSSPKQILIGPCFWLHKNHSIVVRFLINTTIIFRNIKIPSELHSHYPLDSGLCTRNTGWIWCCWATHTKITIGPCSKTRAKTLRPSCW